MVAIDLGKQQASKNNIAINFTVNLDRDGKTTMFFIIEDAKETILDF